MTKHLRKRKKSPALDCNYVLKVQPNSRVFENERDILYKLNKIQPPLAPYLYDAWTCEGQGFLVMERMEGDIQKRKLTIKDVDKIEKLVARLHSLKIAFTDLHEGNILTKDKDQFFLTDFGLAVDYEDVPEGYELFVYHAQDKLNFTDAAAFDTRFVTTLKEHIL